MQCEPAPRFESLPAAQYYFVLVLCGTVTVLLGPILPVLTAQWHLTDVQGGWLFAAQFSSSTIGAVLSSHFPRKSLVSGCASVSAGVAMLLVPHYAASLAAFGLIGLGTGLVVSATNLIFGTEYPERRGALLTRVNLSWGIGAVLAPELVALALRAHALRIFVLLVALIVALAFALFTPLLRRGRTGEPREPSTVARDAHAGLPIFVLFSVMLFLYVGAETTVAGWIATYVHRLSGLSVARASLFVSVFWVSLLAGRWLVVAVLRWLAEVAVLLGGLALAMGGVVTLLHPHPVWVLLAAVVAAGLGCGPIFPLSVSRMLARTGRTRHAGWVFAICGSGGAVAPWITGLISEHGGGLRTAFAVPLAALAGILLCVVIESAMKRPEARLI
ncbi:MAG TPA: MFS transporter [Acidobacteriaceae bacterium]|nr:MFS transporter [Acidobacteriaceae bacterium]